MSQTEYRLDPLHSGIRFTVLLVLVAGVLLGWTIIMPSLLHLINFTSPIGALVNIVLGLAFGLMVGWGTERLLINIWPSGRTLETSDGKIVLKEKHGNQTSINLSKRFNCLQWYFVIKTGRASVPKGWYCTAIQLIQDDTSICAYSFMKPEQAALLANWSEFEELVSRKVVPKQGQDHLFKRYAEQGQLRVAEQTRWEYGAEMVPTDFQEYWEHIRSTNEK